MSEALFYGVLALLGIVSAVKLLREWRSGGPR